eukprot:TRINITY_DN830_c0_g2_i1.p1 TRINITY_DN830_c0_g2~~TRINITY_DN830_c0_g2_i1.p1  ORF type:complete len:164 (-),score=58.98 TRINITY_DN830_c0_g2_i1:80-571(-)
MCIRDRIKTAFSGILEAVNAKNQGRAKELSEKIIKEIEAVKARYPNVDLRRLRIHGYEFAACDDNLKRLQNDIVRIQKSIKISNPRAIIGERNRIAELINRTAQSCVKAEESAERLYNENKDKPACQEAARKYKEEGSAENKRQALLLEAYIACGKPIYAKKN